MVVTTNRYPTADTGELVQIGDTLDWTTETKYGTISLRFVLKTKKERAEKKIVQALGDGVLLKKLRAKIERGMREHIMGHVYHVEIHDDALDFVDARGDLIMRQLW